MGSASMSSKALSRMLEVRCQKSKHNGETGKDQSGEGGYVSSDIA